MKSVTVVMVLMALLLVLTETTLWAGSTRTVAVSCVVLPRVAVEMTPDPGLAQPEKTPSALAGLATDGLVRKKEYKTQDSPPLHQRAIVYTYSAR